MKEGPLDCRTLVHLLPIKTQEFVPRSPCPRQLGGQSSVYIHARFAPQSVQERSSFFVSALPDPRRRQFFSCRWLPVTKALSEKVSRFPLQIIMIMHVEMQLPIASTNKLVTELIHSVRMLPRAKEKHFFKQNSPFFCGSELAMSTKERTPPVKALQASRFELRRWHICSCLPFSTGHSLRLKPDWAIMLTKSLVRTKRAEELTLTGRQGGGGTFPSVEGVGDGDVSLSLTCCSFSSNEKSRRLGEFVGAESTNSGTMKQRRRRSEREIHRSAIFFFSFPKSNHK